MQLRAARITGARGQAPGRLLTAPSFSHRKQLDRTAALGLPGATAGWALGSEGVRLAHRRHCGGARPPRAPGTRAAALSVLKARPGGTRGLGKVPEFGASASPVK